MERRVPRPTGSVEGQDTTGDEASDTFGVPVDPTRLVRVLLVHKRWLVLTAILGLVIGVGTALMLPRTYKSNAVLRFDPAGETGVSAREATQSAMATANEAFHSAVFLRRLKQ